MKSTVHFSEISHPNPWTTLIAVLAIMFATLFFATAVKADETKSEGRKAAVALVKNSGLEKLLATLKAEQACHPEHVIEGLMLNDKATFACLGLDTELAVFTAANR
ncbi:hypothetical protein IT409_01045 [Candidatus Falkowbacteria bacterium]|nr:hypothetical protein [Candidatus Falkowbacteria bacterium]